MNILKLIESALQHLQNAEDAINATTVPLSKWKTTRYVDITKTKWWIFFNEMELAEKDLAAARAFFKPAGGGFALLFLNERGL
jgi:hypothetical protein